MNIPRNYKNGWLHRTAIVGTGVAMGTVISLCAALTDIPVGTAGIRLIPTNNGRLAHDSLMPRLKIYSSSLPANARTIIEDLDKIRSVLKLAISELSGTLGVSRQAIYNWKAGEEPIPMHADKIRDIAHAADIFENAGIAVTSHILKRKLFEGKSLLEIVKDGGSGTDAAKFAVEMLNREHQQRQSLDKRLAERSRMAELGQIGLPAFNERL